MTRICGQPAIKWDYPTKPTGIAYTNSFYVKGYGTGAIYKAFASVEYDRQEKTVDIAVVACDVKSDDLRCSHFEIPTDHEPTLDEIRDICHNVEVWAISPALAGMGFRGYVDADGRRI